MKIDSKYYKSSVLGCPCLGLLVFLLLAAINSFGQASVELDMKCIQTKDEIQFEFKAIASGEEENYPASDLWIFLYNLGTDEEVLIDSTSADKDGKGVIIKSKSESFLKNETGGMTFIARTLSNDEYEASESWDISLKPAYLEISFEEDEEDKLVTIKGFEVDPENGELPIDGYDVYLYVPRLFSLLNVGEVYLDVGEGSAKFPVDLPGDSIGNLTIIAQIEDDDTYANVLVEGSKDWGKPRPQLEPKRNRGLGDTDAPLWMVYTLIVLLSLVWFHYLYVFYSLFRIKRWEGK